MSNRSAVRNCVEAAAAVAVSIVTVVMAAIAWLLVRSSLPALYACCPAARLHFIPARLYLAFTSTCTLPAPIPVHKHCCPDINRCLLGGYEMS